MGDHNRMVAALGSPNLMEATNAAGILCTILSLDCQSTRTAISSSPLIVTNIEKALSGTGDLPHNAALLVSMLSTITSFRRAFVKSDGLGLLVDLLTKSEDAGEQTNLLYAIVTLAKGGRDCHTELYELLAESGMAWTLVRTLMQSPDAKVEENARALAGQLRTMPQSLALSAPARLMPSMPLHCCPATIATQVRRLLHKMPVPLTGVLAANHLHVISERTGPRPLGTGQKRRGN